MATAFHLDLSYTFPAIIWNMLADSDTQRLFLEVRDPNEKTVSFSALNLRNNQWLWKDLRLEEPWWVNLRAVSGDILLFTVYVDANNPDKKSVVAYHVIGEKVIWWRNGFAITNVFNGRVKGVDSRFPGKDTFLDLFTGQETQENDFHLEDSQNFPVIRPFQYEEGTAHFNTVREFFASRLGIAPVATIEYLEYKELIFVSVVVNEEGLANYLYGLDANGELLIKEKLGENLKGVGLDTFFIISDHLIFVRNKNELKSYLIV